MLLEHRWTKAESCAIEVKRATDRPADIPVERSAGSAGEDERYSGSRAWMPGACLGSTSAGPARDAAILTQSGV